MLRGNFFRLNLRLFLCFCYPWSSVLKGYFFSDCACLARPLSAPILASVHYKEGETQEPFMSLQSGHPDIMAGLQEAVPWKQTYPFSFLWFLLICKILRFTGVWWIEWVKKWFIVKEDSKGQENRTMKLAEYWWTWLNIHPISQN